MKEETANQRAEVICSRSHGDLESLSFYSASYWKPLRTGVFFSRSYNLPAFLPDSYHITSSWELPGLPSPPFSKTRVSAEVN